MIQTVWSGGVTRDGVTPITPGSSTALPRLLNVWLADGRALDDDAESRESDGDLTAAAAAAVAAQLARANTEA